MGIRRSRDGSDLLRGPRFRVALRISRLRLPVRADPGRARPRPHGADRARATTISAAAFAGVIACVASASGGLNSAAAIWLIAVPLEALVSGSRRASVSATFVAGLTVLVLAILRRDGRGPGRERVARGPVGAGLRAVRHRARRFPRPRGLAQPGRAGPGAARPNGARPPLSCRSSTTFVAWHDENGHVLSASPRGHEARRSAPRRRSRIAACSPACISRTAPPS